MDEEESLRGHGLLLRPLGTADLEQIRAACDDPLFLRWLPWRSGGYTRDSAERFLSEFAEKNWARGLPVWAICLEDSPGDLIGVLDLRDRGAGAWEIGYWMRADYRGRGLMQLANYLAINFAFNTLGALRIMHFARVGNYQSRKVARLLGFVPEGVRRKPVGEHGVERQWQHSLLRSDWARQPWAKSA